MIRHFKIMAQNLLLSQWNQLQQYLNRTNNIDMTINFQMNLEINSQQNKRQKIRNSLQGTLNAWKLNLLHVGHQKQLDIQDRTPVRGVTEFTFDDAFVTSRKIGEGASGSVHICQSKKDGKQYAVKISRGDEQLIRIAKKTFKFLKQLNHPSIIKAKFLFLNQQREKIHLVMEYFPHPSLLDICDHLTVEEKQKIITKILETLIYLHKKGICHRDIKLENILYDSSTEAIKVIDFGISKKIRKHCFRENMWTITGTLKYMAPEVLNGADYNETVDCWALGILTYRLFYGRYPFQSQYKSEIIKQITGAEPAYQEQFGLLNDFLKRLLYKNGQHRSTAVEALRHPWINGQQIQKPRLGSEDNVEIPQFEHRLRNYSSVQQDSPIFIPSREQMITSLKQIDIYENKVQHKKILNHTH